MGQNFLPDTVNQTLLFPPSLHDWLPDGHLARFVVDVVSALDLDAIYASYGEKDGRGQSAYAPEMMVRLLLYGYATGVYSSRKIETRTYEDVAFRYLAGDPDMVLLDNMSPEDVRRAVERCSREDERKSGGRIPIECSGGVHLENVRAYAETGVDFISVGLLTHSTHAVDMSLRVVPA